MSWPTPPSIEVLVGMLKTVVDVKVVEVVVENIEMTEEVDGI